MRTTLASLALPGAAAFLSTAPSQCRVPLRLSSSFQDEVAVPESELQEQKEVAMPLVLKIPKSEALPFLDCPPVLAESTLVGNFGFDPLKLSTNKEMLWEYREAEIKHSRLAMLVSEIAAAEELSNEVI